MSAAEELARATAAAPGRRPPTSEAGAERERLLRRACPRRSVTHGPGLRDSNHDDRRHGVGKTVLAAMFIHEGLLVGDKVVYIACDEPPDSMRQNMANLRLGTLAHERLGRLVFVDAFARERSRERVAIPTQRPRRVLCLRARRNRPPGPRADPADRRFDLDHLQHHGPGVDHRLQPQPAALPARAGGADARQLRHRPAG